MSTVVLVDEIYVSRYKIKKVMQEAGYSVYDFGSIDDVYSDPAIIQWADLLLLSISNDVQEMIRFVEENSVNIPSIIMASNPDIESVKRAIDAGVVDFVAKPFSPEELVDRIKQIIPASKVNIAISQLIDAELSRSLRGEYPVSIVLADLDGALISPKQKRALRRDFRTLLRSVDIVLEHGSKLMIILPFTSISEIETVCSKLIWHVHKFRDRFPFKIRFGAASFPEECSNHDELLNLAERRLITSSIKLPNIGTVATLKPGRHDLRLRSNVNGERIKLIWERVNSAKEYEVKRYANGMLEFSTTKIVNQYTDRDIRGGVEYTYRVSALNGALRIVASDEVRVQTQESATSPLVGTR